MASVTLLPGWMRSRHSARRPVSEMFTSVASAPWGLMRSPVIDGTDDAGKRGATVSSAVVGGDDGVTGPPVLRIRRTRRTGTGVPAIPRAGWPRRASRLHADRALPTGRDPAG